MCMLAAGDAVGPDELLGAADVVAEPVSSRFTSEETMSGALLSGGEGGEAAVSAGMCFMSMSPGWAVAREEP